MPQVIIPAALSAGLKVGVAKLFTAVFFKAFVTHFFVYAALYALSKASARGNFSVEAQGRTSLIRSPTEPRRIVVGESLVSGPLVAYFATDSTEQSTIREGYTIPTGTPSITVAHAADWIESVQVRILNIIGDPRSGSSYVYTAMMQVGSSPAAGEYSVAAGVYTFNAADKAKNVEILYKYNAVVIEAEWHWFVIPLSHGEVASIGDVFLNGEPVGTLDATGMATTGRFAYHVRIKKYLGTLTQVADPDLIAASDGDWTVDHKGLGVAYIIVALKRNPEVFESGVPNITAYVRGVKCLDPRDGQTRWTNNPALVIRKYLKEKFGLACDDEEIDDAFTIAAANICDERVAMSAYSVDFTADPATDAITFSTTDERIDTGDKVQVSNAGGALPGGLAAATNYYAIRLRDGSNKAKLATTYANALAGTAINITSAGTGTHSMSHIDQARYTCDGTINTADRMLDVLGALLSSMAGVAPYSMGSFKLAAGAYTAPVKSWTPNQLRGPIQMRARTPRKELFNTVRGTYVNPFKEWQPGDFPPVKNDTYIAQDDPAAVPVPIERDIDLAYTINSVRAQRLAKILLEKSRQQIVCSVPLKLHGLAVAPNENIDYTDADFGWTNKVFRVSNWKLAANGRGVDVEWQEDSSASWAWSAGEETTIDPAPDTTLPTPFVVLPPGQPVVVEELYDTERAVKVRANLTCEASVDNYVASYQFEYKLSSSPTWKRLPASSVPAASIEDISPGLYDFRVSALNRIGVRSLYSSVFGVQVLGLGAAPATPVILGLQTVGGLAMLSLQPHPDLDVRRGGRWRVRHSNATVGALWEESFSIGEDQSYMGDQTVLTLPLKAGTYLVKAEDSLGNLSVNFASITTKRAQAIAFTALSSIQEDAVFSGTHVNTMVDGVVLKLVGVGMLDDIADFDSISSLDDYGGVSPTGSYTFSAGFDFTTVKNVRVASDIEGATVNVNDLIDDRTDNIDNWLDFDGLSSGGNADAWLECRETDDNPSGSPTWSVWKRLDASEFACRGMQFRLQMRSTDPAYNLHVDRLRVSAEQAI